MGERRCPGGVGGYEKDEEESTFEEVNEGGGGGGLGVGT